MPHSKSGSPCASAVLGRQDALPSQMAESGRHTAGHLRDVGSRPCSVSLALKLLRIHVWAASLLISKTLGADCPDSPGQIPPLLFLQGRLHGALDNSGEAGASGCRRKAA